MPEYRLRPYTPRDAQAVVDVINAASMLEPGFPLAVVDAVGSIRHHRYVPANSEKVVAINDEGQIIGYAYLADRENSIVMETRGAVHPDYWGREIGRALMGWAEQQARAISNQAPAGIRTILQVNLFEGEARVTRLLSECGYARVREWTHMELEMREPFAAPFLADGLILREMDLENDWDIVGAAMDEAYADHWGAIPPSVFGFVEEIAEGSGQAETAAPPSDESFSNAAGNCFIVLDGEIVAGGILCNAKLVERKDTGRVGSVFVRPAYRRRRIGHTLMQTALNSFWDKGIRRVVLDTDSESFTQSAKFYSGLGMRPYRREFLFEKEIRPGREVRRLNM